MSLTHEQRERERKSLQDLARLAQMTPAPSSARIPVAPVSAAPSKPSNDDVMMPSSRKEEDSGLVNFAAFSPQPPASAPHSAPSSMRGMDQVMGAAAPMSSPNGPISSPPARVSTPGEARDRAGLFDDEPLSGHPPSVAPGPLSAPPGFVSTLPSGGVPQLVDSVRAPVSAAVPQSAHPSAYPAQTAQPQKKRGAVVYMIGTVVALAAVAAGGVLVVRPMVLKSRQAAMTAKVETKVEAPTPVSPETRWQDQIAAAKPADPAPAADIDKASDKADDIDVKPQAKVAAVTPPPAFAKKAGGAPPKDNKVAAAFVLNDEPKPAPAPPPPVAEQPKPASGGAGSDLEGAMKTAAGPSDSTNVRTADEKKPSFAPGTVPQRPSQGAVTGAIGAALPNARACLGPDDAVSRATITFNGADGTVSSVVVRGGAAGKPAEQCIKGALLAAKVPPFAESTYSAPVTVRH